MTPGPPSSLWDSLIVPYDGRPELQAPTPAGSDARRRGRTAEFTQFLGSFRASADEPGRRDILLKASAAYQNRCLAWVAYAGKISSDEDVRRRFNAVASGGLYTSGSLLFWYPLLLSVSVISRFLRIGRMHHLTRSLVRRRCPDCGYLLNGLEPGRGIAAVCDVTPDLCPECGANWPLLPPVTRR